jgi:hypothetical protein
MAPGLYLRLKRKGVVLEWQVDFVNDPGLMASLLLKWLEALGIVAATLGSVLAWQHRQAIVQSWLVSTWAPQNVTTTALIMATTLAREQIQHLQERSSSRRDIS